MNIWFFLHNKNNCAKILRHLTFFLKKSNGQALSEIIFAFAMAGMLLSGMIVAVRAGVLNAQYARHRVQAAFLAQEAIEKAYKYRAEKGFNNITNSSTNQFGDTGADFVQINGRNSIFRRSVNIISGSSDEKTVSVRVYWDEYGIQKSVYLSALLTNHD